MQLLARNLQIFINYQKTTMRNIIWCLSTILLIAYLIAIFVWIGLAIEGPKCTGMEIKITQSGGNSSFVTVQEIAREMDNLPDYCKGMPIKEINTDSLERLLNSIDKIEKASCVILNSGRIIVGITPMQPVARIFDGKNSYYINRVGKRISADARYHLDVPVVAGNFDSLHQAQSLLPLLDYIKSDSMWNTIISMVKIDEKKDIILVPAIKGHVINFGNMENMDNKFVRLRRFYQEVMPIKGWSYYETIAVKWDGQIVATKRKKKVIDKDLTYDEEIENELPDVATMQVEEQQSNNE